MTEIGVRKRDAAMRRGGLRSLGFSADVLFAVRSISLCSTNPDAERSLANGKIEMVVGPRNTTDAVNVELSTQPVMNLTHKPREFSDDGSTDLELAYALTVHRAQGSEFETVFLVLPRNRRMLSREMLYAALTRHKVKVVILFEGQAIELASLASDRFSKTKSRLTNLFRSPNPKRFDRTYLDANLIHQAERGELVRSKSEVIIANHLNRRGVNCRYEEPLKLGDDVRIPDFTFEDDDSGITYYWEHCGILFNADYARRWGKEKIKQEIQHFVPGRKRRREVQDHNI